MIQTIRVANKYRQKATVFNGIKFKSKTEAGRYRDLWLLERAGAISALRYEPFELDLVVGGVKIGTYTPDFVYEEGGVTVIEDAKCAIDAAFAFKWKIILALWRHRYQCRIWPERLTKKIRIPNELKGTL